MKKKLSSHDDTPSTPLTPKTIEVEQVNNEGNVREAKYSVDENYTPDKSGTQSVVRNERNPDYWLPAEDIDIYAVDTRIWDRIGEMGGDGGGPHTHDGYADAQELADHLANHPEGGGDGYDDTALTARVEQNETDIAGLEAENNSQNVNIQANTDGLAGKADVVHIHDGRAYNGPVLREDYTGSYQQGIYPQAAGNFVMDTDPTGTFYLNHFVGGLYVLDSTRGVNYYANGGYALWGIKTSSGDYVNVLKDAEHWNNGSGNGWGVLHAAGDHAQGQFEMPVGAIEQATADDLSAISAAWVSNATDAYHLIGTYDWFFLSNNAIFHAHMYSLGLGGTSRRAKTTTFSQEAWDEYLAKQEPADG